MTINSIAQLYNVLNNYLGAQSTFIHLSNAKNKSNLSMDKVLADIAQCESELRLVIDTSSSLNPELQRLLDDLNKSQDRTPQTLKRFLDELRYINI